MLASVLILPGLGDSGPDHWQSLWEAADPSFIRVQQREWEHAKCTEWVDALEQAAQLHGRQVVLVAHSLACLQVAHWAVHTETLVQGALLVAPPDPDGENFPKTAQGFSPVPMAALKFPGIVVASANDPYASLEFARRCAASWRCEFVDAGMQGHLNAASGLGWWPAGRELLQKLLVS